MTPNITIRFAEPHEGPIVRDLLAEGKSALATLCDWDRLLGPYWLLAILHVPIACINVCPGQPVGKLEYLSTKEGLRHRHKALAVYRLLMAGMAVLEKGGSQFAGSYIPDDLQPYQTVLKNRGGVAMESGTYFMKRI